MVSALKALYEDLPNLATDQSVVPYATVEPTLKVGSRGSVPHRAAFNASYVAVCGRPATNVSVHGLGLTAMIAEDALPS